MSRFHNRYSADNVDDETIQQLIEESEVAKLTEEAEATEAAEPVDPNWFKDGPQFDEQFQGQDVDPTMLPWVKPQLLPGVSLEDDAERPWKQEDYERKRQKGFSEEDQNALFDSKALRTNEDTTTTQQFLEEVCDYFSSVVISKKNELSQIKRNIQEAYEEAEKTGKIKFGTDPEYFVIAISDILKGFQGFYRTYLSRHSGFPDLAETEVGPAITSIFGDAGLEVFGNKIKEIKYKSRGGEVFKDRLLEAYDTLTRFIDSILSLEELEPRDLMTPIAQNQPIYTTILKKFKDTIEKKK